MPKPRPRSDRKPRKKLYIYCEGEKTEPNYIEGYIRSKKDGALRDVVKVQPTRKNTPAQLVDVAIEHKKSGPALVGDVFWVVYDRESVAKYSDELHDRAHKKAKDNDVNIALSNICFEMWLLLHLKNSSAPYSSFDDLIHRSPLKAEFKRLCGKDYEKANIDVFNVLSGNVALARERAVKINQLAMGAAVGGRDKPHHLNPYTDMPKLLNAIDEFK